MPRFEQWKAIPGFAGIYEVSDAGRVRSLDCIRPHRGYRPRHWKGKILKVRGNKYKQIALWPLDGPVQWHWVHILVVSSFLGVKPSPKHEVNHKNGIKHDNRLVNLEWATRRENHDHATRVLKIRGKKLTYAKVRRIRNELLSKQIKELAAKYKVSRTTLWKIKTGQWWAHAL